MVDVVLTTSNIPATTYGGQWDHLPLPGGGTIGTTPDTQVLRQIFHRMGIPESHKLGREILCGRYAAKLREVANEASDKAVMDFVRQYEEQTNVTG